MVGAVGWALDRSGIAAAGLIAAAALAGAFVVHKFASERRRHEAAEDELAAQASFLESLVESIAAVSSPLDPEEIVARACDEARRLFDARSVRFVPPGEPTQETAGTLLVPLAVRGEAIGSLAISRSQPFERWDRTRATVLADFASRAVENARLLAEAHERESERGRLTEQLITAEQDERRRLSLFLHDGPVQAMAGIALMHDAALAAIEDGRYEDAAKVIESSLERERRTIQELRDLSFAIEPLVLRDQGFDAAVRALADQVEESHGITVAASVAPGERLSEQAQVALYQVIREAINQAVRRRPGQIGVTVEELADGDFATEVDDDGVDERRRASIEAIEERVRVLNGRLSIEPREEGGTAIRVVMPAYVAAAQG
ncbi:MAG TPA: histidine kinase [Gaiellaceae bacterium]|nr:histidine kinase [Gaiellaceae bacterium]